MKKYCAIYLGTPAGREKWNKLDEATRKQREQQGMKAWQDWVTKNKAAIVDNGSPLGKTKRVDARGISDTSKPWRLTRSSRRSRTRPPRSCSRITRTSRSSPATAIEIMECLPIPGM